MLLTRRGHSVVCGCSNGILSGSLGLINGSYGDLLLQLLDIVELVVDGTQLSFGLCETSLVGSDALSLCQSLYSELSFELEHARLHSSEAARLDGDLVFRLGQAEHLAMEEPLRLGLSLQLVEKHGLDGTGWWQAIAALAANAHEVLGAIALDSGRVEGVF